MHRQIFTFIDMDLREGQSGGVDFLVPVYFFIFGCLATKIKSKAKKTIPKAEKWQRARSSIETKYVADLIRYQELQARKRGAFVTQVKNTRKNPEKN